MSRHGQRVRPSRPMKTVGEAMSRDEERLRPLYSRVLGLRHVDPGGLLCFCFFEGAIVLALLLTLAELVSWWAVLVLPVSVALMVKLNDEVAAAVARSAAQVPQREREAFRRELAPVIGRATVPGRPGPAPRPAPVDAATEPLSMVGARLAGLLGGPAATAALRGATGALRALTAGPGPETTGAGSGTAGPASTATDRSTPPPVQAKPTNEHPIEPLGPQPAAQWPAGLDETDSPQQRTRQTARRRYE